MDDPKLNCRLTSSWSRVRHGQLALFTLCFAVAMLVLPGITAAQQANWIWSPKAGDLSSGQPQGTCYYRTKFTLIKPEQAEITFSAGDEYALYLNNRLVSKGESYGSESKLNVFKYVQPGVNLVAVMVNHVGSDKPGLAMKIRVKEKDETRWRSLVSDNSWKTRRDLITAWKQPAYNDMGWLKAKTIVAPASQPATATTTKPAVKQGVPAKQVNATKKVPVAPVYVQPDVSGAGPIASVETAAEATPATTPVYQNAAKAKGATAVAADVKLAANPATPKSAARSAATKSAAKPWGEGSRFTVDSEFTVQQVLTSKDAGPIVAMEFNEFGKLLFARKDGPLMIADLSLPVGSPERVRVYCDKVVNCGGILPINGDVYVTGDGPSGLAMYRLTDTEKRGVAQPAKALFKFSGKAGTHGPHSMQLGPDAMIYMTLGNGSQIDRPVSETSPYRFPYEGDVVPRFEDPSGHAAGVKAPGGTIVRCSLDGAKIETFAGGLRNVNDFVFDENGQLFVHDSDNAADFGTPWYRSSMLFHVPAGADFGWRRGSGKFAKHFVDMAESVCDMNSGAATGAVAYRHLQFPARFHNSMFTANRSTGQVINVRPERDGAGFTATPETFLTGKSFDVTDLAVGEDGALYIATGDAGSVGGLYRVVWNGEVPADQLEFESDLAKVIRHPQPDSTWARQNVAQLKITIGREWNKAIRGVAAEKRNPVSFRMRALQLMVLYGPQPDSAMLSDLASEDDAELRAQVARLCGASGDRHSQQALKTLLTDTTPFVRLAAAEAMLQLGVVPEFDALAELLKSEDRTEAAVARRLLERIPAEQWAEEILSTEDKRLFIQGAVTLSIATPSLENSYAILARASRFMEGFVNDADFVDMLRTMQLALVQAKVDPAQIPGFAARISNEFPSGNTLMNLELARLLGYLKAGDLDGRLESYLADEEISDSDKLAVAMQLQAAAETLSGDELLAVLGQLEDVRLTAKSGKSYTGYVNQAIKQCGQFISAEHAETILASPERYASSLIPAFYHVPAKLDAQKLKQLIDLDQSFVDKRDEQSLQVRLGVVALLAQSGDADSMVYLRKLWQTEDYRRSDIAIGLAQRPSGENWSYLVSTLPLLNQGSAAEVLNGLKSVPRKPRDVRHFREVIRIAETMDKSSTTAALALLEHWAGQSLADGSNDRSKLITSWKQWCEQNFDSQPAASTADGSDTDRF